VERRRRTMGPIRRGISKNLTLEKEAVAILESMASGRTHQGKLISSLLRQEEARRHELRQMRERVAEALQAEIDRAVG
jgi:hypothetical protein